MDEIFNKYSTRLIFELTQCKVVKRMLVRQERIQTYKRRYLYHDRELNLEYVFSILFINDTSHNCDHLDR